MEALAFPLPARGSSVAATVHSTPQRAERLGKAAVPDTPRGSGSPLATLILIHATVFKCLIFLGGRVSDGLEDKESLKLPRPGTLETQNPRWDNFCCFSLCFGSGHPFPEAAEAVPR